MGLLVLGEPLTWQTTAQLKNYVKFNGIQQFISVWLKHKDRKCDRFLWGDEIETLLLYIDPKTREIQIQLRAHQILQKLQEEQDEMAKINPGSEWNVIFHPEYGNFMLEVTPNLPYGSFTTDLLHVETNMRLRRTLLQSHLKCGELILTCCNFPLFGTPGFAHDVPSVTTEHLAKTIGGPVLKSSYVPDCVMSPHPRFATLSGNIRRRRGKKVDIKLPIFRDTHTKMEALTTTNDDHIHSDAMGFGMGACCLQVTFQTRSNKEARFLYDQLAILSPLFLSLTANTPFHRGVVVDTDVRWDTICQSVDDRTEAEMGNATYDATQDPQHIPPTPRAEAISHERQDIPELNVENPFVTYFKTKKDELIQYYNTNKDSILANLEQYKMCTTVDQALNKTTTPTTSEDQVDNATNGVGIPYNDLPFALPISLQDIVNNIEHNTPYPTTPAELSKLRLNKSRYSSIDCYISNDPAMGYKAEYNDVNFPYHQGVYYLLRDAEIDSLMAKHIASLFVRDPLVMFNGQINVDNNANVNHFESIQSTNWRSVRYKPPSHSAQPAWRVEFRTMELQFTDFENAAFTTFITLLSRAIVYYSLNFYIPLTLVDQNFTTAHKKDSIVADKFWWKVNVNITDLYQEQIYSTITTHNNTNNNTPCNHHNHHTHAHPQQDLDQYETPEQYNQQYPTPCQMLQKKNQEDDYYELLTMSEIMNGCTKVDPKTNKTYTYCGLIPIVQRYVNTVIISSYNDDEDCEPTEREVEMKKDTVSVLNSYIDLIAYRSQGNLLTGAALQRAFVQHHPKYQQDSVLTQDIVYDLSLFLHGLGNLNCTVEQLIGNLDPTTVNRAREAADVAEDDTIVFKNVEELTADLKTLYDPTTTTADNKLKKVLSINEHMIVQQCYEDPASVMNTLTELTQPQQPQLDMAQSSSSSSDDDGLTPLAQMTLGSTNTPLCSPQEPTRHSGQQSNTTCDITPSQLSSTASEYSIVASIPVFDVHDVVLSPTVGNNANNNSGGSANKSFNSNNNSITVLSSTPSGTTLLLNARSNSTKLLTNPHTSKIGGSFTAGEAKEQLNAPNGSFLPGSIECTSHHPVALQRIFSSKGDNNNKSGNSPIPQ